MSHSIHLQSFRILSLCIVIVSVLSCASDSNSTVAGKKFYVSTTGSDESGNGSETKPWRTIENAIKKIPKSGNVEVLLENGIYDGYTLIERGFEAEVVLRSKEPYGAMLTNISDNFTPIFMIDYEGAANLVIQDLVFSNEGTTQGECVNRYGLMIHFSNVTDLRFENNIVFGNNRMPRCNEMLKINIVDTSTFPKNIVVRGNVFGNPPAVDGNDLIDVFEPGEIDIVDNIFYSNRGLAKGNAFIRLWGEWGSDDTRIPRYNISRNIFLRYEGNSEDGYIAFGGEGSSIAEVSHAFIENNLFVGDSTSPLLAPFVFRGVRNVTLRANTLVGDFPSQNFVMNIGTDVGNPESRDVLMYNNIFSDPTSSMDPFLATDGDVDLGLIGLENNLFWNGGDALPTGSELDPNVDGARIEADPLLPAMPSAMVFPQWDFDQGKFESGKSSIRDEFERLVDVYAKIGESSPARDAADANNMPEDDILGRTRDGSPDIGAYEWID